MGMAKALGTRPVLLPSPRDTNGHCSVWGVHWAQVCVYASCGPVSPALHSSSKRGPSVRRTLGEAPRRPPSAGGRHRRPRRSAQRTRTTRARPLQRSAALLRDPRWLLRPPGRPWRAAEACSAAAAAGSAALRPAAEARGVWRARLRRHGAAQRGTGAWRSATKLTTPGRLCRFYKAVDLFMQTYHMVATNGVRDHAT